MPLNKRPSGQNCFICQNIWKKKQIIIKCSNCKKVIHGPSGKKSCSLLTIEEYNNLNVSDRLTEWICPYCTANELPFHSLDDGQFKVQFQPFITNPIIFPNSDVQLFINKCNSIDYTDDRSSEAMSNDELDDIYNKINSKYYGIHEINKIKINSAASLNLGHVNIASLSKHFEDLHLTLSSLKIKFDIIGISEHKINSNGPIINIDIEGYKPFIYDISETSHGGTGFYIKNTINYKMRDDLKLFSPGDFESTFIEVIMPNRKNMVIGCIYRHPSSKISIGDFTSVWIDPLLTKVASEEKLFSLMGDFNIDLIKSDSNVDANFFYNTMSSHLCAPFILQPSRPSSGTLIDNIFVNSVEFKSHSGNLSILLSDHFFQFVLLENFFKSTVHKNPKIRERSFRNFNEREFRETLDDIQWDSILQLHLKDPNLAINNFHSKINYILDELAPYRTLSKKELNLKSKPWLNNDILNMIKKRDKLLKRMNKCSDPELKLDLLKNFKVLRNEITKIKRQAKADYYKKFFESNKTKSSSVWKGIRSIIRLKSTSFNSYLKVLNNDGSLISNPHEVANKFNSYFAKIGPSLESEIPPSSKSYADFLKKVNVRHSFFMKPTSCYEISKIISNLDSGKSLGPNSVPIYILKVSNDFFSELLSKVINLSFETGIFPDLCKLAKVIPIFKAGNENLCENYRPISLLPIYSKIFEKAMYSRIYEFLNKNNLIYNQQFGFRANHSTNHAIISLSEDIKSLLDTGQFVTGVFLDLKRAFDTINHKILIDKLYHYGFRGISNKLLQSYLENRKQYVSINGHDSGPEIVKCGIPQGSTLGPLLFILYINDLRFCLHKSRAYHFADDTCITYSHKNQMALQEAMNNDLANVVEWLKANRLSLNVSKTKLLIFRSKRKKIDMSNFSIKLSGSTLEASKEVKYLGIYFDENLSWDTHIKYLCPKLSKANGIISKLRHFLPKQTLISVYYALFNSHLSYGCISWSLTTKKNIQQISILQKKCMRIINFKPFDHHTNDLFSSNKILKLNEIIKSEQLSIAFQFISNLLPNELMNLFNVNVNNYNTRNMMNSGLTVPRIRTLSFGDRTIMFTVPKIWNEFIKTHDFTQFKSYKHFRNFLKSYYLSTYS